MANWQRMVRTALIFGVGIIPAPAAADPIDPTAVEVVAGIKANENAYKLYALGVICELWSANNTVIVNSKGPFRIYCPPAALYITAEQAGNIIENYVDKYPSVRNLSGRAELSYALIEIFPCH